jgi:hypothetical protein
LFETEQELAGLQRLLDESFQRAGERHYAIWEPGNTLTAVQLSGFRGIKLMAIATVNSDGEPRVAPRSAAFLHGKFYLAANTASVMIKRLSRKPLVGITYFENHLMIVAHGKAVPFRRGTPGFDALSPEWERAFMGGASALEGVDILIGVDAANMLAYANRPERYPDAWGKEPPGVRGERKAGSEAGQRRS